MHETYCQLCKMFFMDKVYFLFVVRCDNVLINSLKLSESSYETILKIQTILLIVI